MSRKVYILSSPWLRAAAEFRRLKAYLVFNADLGRFAWLREGVGDERVRHEVQFVWGDNVDYGQPLRPDMYAMHGPAALESAARVAESLAYDNTDGPADEEVTRG